MWVFVILLARDLKIIYVTEITNVWKNSHSPHTLLSHGTYTPCLFLSTSLSFVGVSSSVVEFYFLSQVASQYVGIALCSPNQVCLV